MPLPTTGWHKSSYNSDYEDACVEACALPYAGGVLIHDSKDRSCRPPAISQVAWRAFLGRRSAGFAPVS